MRRIYVNADKFKVRRPDCKMFYVTTGKWSDDQQLNARRQSILADVKALEYFNVVEFSPLGGTDIQKLYDQLKNAIRRDLLFERKATLPAITGVTEAHLGLVSGTALLEVVRNGDDIAKSIFYDNVRDWLGEDNRVNGEIKETLLSDERYRFSLMNNGVTIIARNLKRTGDTFHIGDFQVVNGCQTCHALYEVWKAAPLASPLEGVWIPLRLIGTQDEDVINSIVKATNRQTPVTEEQFFALQEFPKQLEKFFAAQQGNRRLYYERRARQYDSSSVDKTRVVTQPAVARAFVAMFLSEPHGTTKSAKALRDKIGKELFGIGHKHYPYYVCAVALYKLEGRFRTKTLDAKYKVAKFHILLALRLLSAGKDRPSSNATAMDAYCQKFADLLWGTGADERIDDAIKAVDKAAGGTFDRDTIRTQAFTEKVMEACGVSKKKLATAAKP